MKNSLRKACILVALDLLDSDSKPKKQKGKVKKRITSSAAAEAAIEGILEAAVDSLYDSTRTEYAGRVYNIAIGSSDPNVRLAGVRAIKRISDECIYDTSRRTCISYMEALA